MSNAERAASAFWLLVIVVAITLVALRDGLLAAVAFVIMVTVMIVALNFAERVVRKVFGDDR